MKTDSCREWRESLGAYALDQLPADERTALGAHLEGCAECRAELDELSALVRPMSLADPARFDTSPTPPATLAARVAATIGRERLAQRRRRVRRGLVFGGAAAAAAVALVLLVLPGGGSSGPERHVTFASLPKGEQISAKLIPNAFGTEIHMYVKGVSSGTLCQVYLRSHKGQRLSAGSFRYRWREGSYPVLSSALDLSETGSMEIKVGDRTFVAAVGGSSQQPTQEVRQ